MPREENLLILKMLQDGTITAEQAAELLAAMDASKSRVVQTGDATLETAASSATSALATPTPVTPPTPPVPPVPPTPPVPPVPPIPGDMGGADSDTLARAKERIRAAREKVAGVQEQLSAAEEKLDKADESANPWESVAEALKDVPGARSLGDTLRGLDPQKLAATARRQARRVARQVRSAVGDIDINLDLHLTERMQGEPTLSAPREATATVPPGGVLRVRNTLGDIEAIGADVPEARIAGVLKIWAADRVAAEELAKEIELVVEQGADGPTVSVKHPARVRRVGLDLKVFVPQGSGTDRDNTVRVGRVSLLSPSGDLAARNLRNAAVVLATQSGDAKASEISGDVALETASGDIAAEGVTGNVSASSASGDITAIRLTGQTFKATTQSGDIILSDSTVSVVAVETVSGDATVRAVTGRTVRVRAVSGDVSANDTLFEADTHLDTVSGFLSASPRTPLSAGTVTLVTVSGDADLKLPARAAGTIDINTKNGDVHARVYGTGNAEKNLSGSGMVSFTETIGEGAAAKIVVTSVSGDLRITEDN